MLRLLADENFNHDILRGVRRRNSAIDVVSAQAVGRANWTTVESKGSLTIGVLAIQKSLPVRGCCQ